MLDVNNIVFIGGSILGTGLLTIPVLWYLFRNETPPSEPKLWERYFLPAKCATILGAWSWGKFADFNSFLISIFLGFGVGYFVAPLFYHPRIAIRGAIIGIKMGLIFSLLFILLESLNGFDLWSIRAWILHILIPISTALFAAIFACQIMKCRPRDLAENFDHPTQTHLIS